MPATQLNSNPVKWARVWPARIVELPAALDSPIATLPQISVSQAAIETLNVE